MVAQRTSGNKDLAISKLNKTMASKTLNKLTKILADNQAILFQLINN